jgi:hypothetical protein
MSNKKSHIHINQSPNSYKFSENNKFIDRNDGSPSRISIKNEKEDNHNSNDES